MYKNLHNNPIQFFEWGFFIVKILHLLNILFSQNKILIFHIFVKNN
jgi:hypothetical protein